MRKMWRICKDGRDESPSYEDAQRGHREAEEGSSGEATQANEKGVSFQSWRQTQNKQKQLNEFEQLVAASTFSCVLPVLRWDQLSADEEALMLMPEPRTDESKEVRRVCRREEAVQLHCTAFCPNCLLCLILSCS